MKRIAFVVSWFYKTFTPTTIFVTIFNKSNLHDTLHEDNCYQCACFKIFTFLSYHLIFKLFSENEKSSFFWKLPSCVFIGYKNVFGPITVLVTNRFRLEQKSYVPLKSGFGKTTIFNGLLGKRFCWASDYLINSSFWSPE
jgi:hypothetical protein